MSLIDLVTPPAAPSASDAASGATPAATAPGRVTSTTSSSSSSSLTSDQSVVSTTAGLSEKEHFENVCDAFAAYGDDALREVGRMARDFAALSPDDQALINAICPIEDRLNHLRDCIAVNEAFIELILKEAADIAPPPADDDVENENIAAAAGCGDGEQHTDGCRRRAECTSAIYRRRRRSRRRVSHGHSNKVRSTLRQFVRDWSLEGRNEREACYDPLLRDLERYLPLTNPGAAAPPAVLCPGSGLGRLPFEVARRGYTCQGNEFSYFMLLGSNLILNCQFEPNSCRLRPFCLSTSNRFGARDHLREVLLPDVAPYREVEGRQDFFSMCAGEFVEVYWTQERMWDGVLTSFFIDTAKNVIQYIRCIARIVRPGGLWANLGPLLYHFGDVVSEISIELSWEELKTLVSRWFHILEENDCIAYYTSDPFSMMRTQYRCVHFAAIRNNVPLEGTSFNVY